MSPQVTVTDNIDDEGLSSLRIETEAGTYYYQKEAAAFSSLVDTGGNDWIGYSTAAGSAGEFRGIPNLVFPEGQFHPGDTTAASTLLHSGPLKATIHSLTNDGQWEAVWEIYPRYARMTLLQTGHEYWFLYEGTPGGELTAIQIRLPVLPVRSRQLPKIGRAIYQGLSGSSSAIPMMTAPFLSPITMTIRPTIRIAL